MIHAQDRRFGVEIECYIPLEYAHNFSVGSYHDGDQIAWLPDGWNAQRDGSLGSKSGHVAMEIVSPPLSGEKGLVEVVTCLDTLQMMGAQVSTACGLHVHVDANDLTTEQVGSVLQNYRTTEKILFSLNGNQARHRYNNMYCRRSDNWGGTDMRYNSVNVKNYFHPTPKAAREGKRTVEFRLFSGTVDATTVVGLVYMAVGLTVVSVNEGIKTFQLTGNVKTDVKALVKDLFRKDYCRIIPDAPVWDVVRNLYQRTNRTNL